MIIDKLVKMLMPKALDNRLRQHYCTKSIIYPQFSLKIEDRKKLDGLNVLVTGGSGGIGSAICLRLAMEGANVGICGRSKDKIDKLSSAITANGGKAYPIYFDISNDEAMEKAIADFVKEVGPLYALVNNAGGSAREKASDFISQKLGVIDDVIRTNLIGTIHCTRFALEKMSLGKGRIINLSSVVAQQGKRGMTDYAASKGGIVSFTRSLALELGPLNITVNSVAPGTTARTMFMEDSDLASANINCMKHGGKPEDIASLIALLLSDEASYITGQNIFVDGGRTLGLWGDN